MAFHVSLCIDLHRALIRGSRQRLEASTAPSGFSWPLQILVKDGQWIKDFIKKNPVRDNCGGYWRHFLSSSLTFAVHCMMFAEITHPNTRLNTPQAERYSGAQLMVRSGTTVSQTLKPPKLCRANQDKTVFQPWKGKKIIGLKQFPTFVWRMQPAFNKPQMHRVKKRHTFPDRKNPARHRWPNLRNRQQMMWDGLVVC